MNKRDAETLLNIPSELLKLRQWVCWKLETVKGRLTKVPYTPGNLKASTTDTQTWESFDVCLAASGGDKSFNGIGFVFAEGGEYTGIDFDHHRDPATGELDAFAKQHVSQLNSYTEISQSGTGVHVIARGVIPSEKGRRDAKRGIEMYSKARFFVMTGAHLEGSPSTIEPRQSAINGLFQEIFGERKKQTKPARDPAQSLSLSDDELLKKASSAKNGARFSALWRGDFASAGYGSQSEADAALLRMLHFWTGGDKARSFRLIEQSGLNRDKWDREDYREATWQLVAGGETYSPQRSKPGSGAREYLGGEPAGESQMMEPPRKYSPPPLTLLPTKLRDYVRAVAKSLDVDVAFIFLPILSALAAAIGNSRILRVKQGFVQPAILWTAIVARSGSKKSPALSAASKFFCDRERELVRLNVAAESVFEEQHRQWDATPKKGRGEEPKPPPRQTCLLDDLTLAVIAPILSNNPRGALDAKDELASWFGSFGQFSQSKGGVSADVSGWLSLFNGERLILDRKTNRESHRIFHPRLSIAGCIPPSVLSGALTTDFFQRGLPARILFAAPPPRPNVWTDAEVPAHLESEAAAIFKRLFALEADQRDTSPVPVELWVDPDGLEVFKAFYNRVGHLAVESGEREEAAWSKLTGYAARLALVGHLAHGFDSVPVGGPIMAAAVELATWFGQEAERMYATFHEPPAAALLRRLVEFIERRGAVVTVKEVADNFRPLKNQTEEIEEQLNGLVGAGRGEWLPVATGEKGGRPTRKFHLVSESAPCPRPLNPQEPLENDSFADADNPGIGKNDGSPDAPALCVGISPESELEPELANADLL